MDRCQSCLSVVQPEAEPEVEHLFVSDATASSFRLSWTSDEDMFDRFVIKIRDSKRVGHPREYGAGGAERTKVITGLMSGTEYEIELYGVTLDERSQPVTGVAQTGICNEKKQQHKTKAVLSFRSGVSSALPLITLLWFRLGNPWKLLALLCGAQLRFCFLDPVPCLQFTLMFPLFQP